MKKRIAKKKKSLLKNLTLLKIDLFIIFMKAEMVEILLQALQKSKKMLFVKK